MEGHVVSTLEVLLILNLLDFEPLLLFDLSDAALAPWQFSFASCPVPRQVIIILLFSPMEPWPVTAPKRRLAFYVPLNLTLFLLLLAPGLRVFHGDFALRLRSLDCLLLGRLCQLLLDHERVIGRNCEHGRL